MNPWDIIGWGVIALMALCVARIGYGYIKLKAGRWLRYMRSRNTKPAKGQLWNQNGTILEIGDRYPAGHFTIKAGNATWGERDEEWENRVRNRKLFLVSGP